MLRYCVCCLLAVGLFVADRARGGDWPQFRYDAGRSASSPEQLSEALHLEWTRALPEPRPAFPGEVRLRFDASYEPIAVGGTLFVPSMVTDSVTALDAATGEVRWVFFAEGPVRFAPTAWDGSLFFVADDGYLYCLDAANGSLRWKFRQPPAEKTDRQVLGNLRLVSLRPARGGPVVQDGVVYFGAGIWSAYGVCVHALDARTGQPLWTNDDSNKIPEANQDHGIANFAGLSPQGYLALIDGRLVVPCGAQLPAFLDPKTGTLDEYFMGWGGRNGLPKGTWFVAGTRNYLSHSGDLYDIRRRNDEQFAAPAPKNNFKPMLYAGRFTRVSIDATNQKDLGAFDEPVFDGDTMYVNDEGLIAYDVTDVQLEERNKENVPAYRKTDTYPDKWQARFQQRWKLATPLKPQIRAGAHLYLTGPGTVEAVRIPAAGEEPRIVWKAAIDGSPQRLVAANGRLFVVTTEGRILAFGATATAQPVTHALPSPPAMPDDKWTTAAADVLDATKVREGYAIVLGVETGRLVEELVRQSDLHVIAIDSDAEKVAQLRQRWHTAGWYGSRVSIKLGDPLTYPLPPYCASLIVSESWQRQRPELDRSTLAGITRVLRPYGGAACLALPAAQLDSLMVQMTTQPLEQFTLRRLPNGLVASRDGALAGSGVWSHEEADAANTGASQEQLVKAPLELLWFDGPPRWFRTPGSTLVRVIGGRMFIMADKLDAVDVYTGRPLWEATFAEPHALTDQFVAQEDALYVTRGRNCTVLEPNSGRIVNQIELPAECTAPWANLRTWQNLLIGQSGNHVVCLDRHSGRTLWNVACERPNLSLAVGGDTVFCAELPDRHRGETAKDTVIRAIRLDGQLLWQIAGGSELRYSAPLDAVVASSGVYRAADGSLLAAMPTVPADPAAKPENLPRPLFVIGPRLLLGTAETFGIYELTSGNAIGNPLAWVRRGCTRPRASAQMVTTRYRGNAACVDLATLEIVPFWNVRAACSNNLYPADGVLNMPSLTGGCTCNYLPVSQAYVPAAAIAGE